MRAHHSRFQAELEALDPIGYLGVNVTSAGLGAQYEKMWRVSFVGSTVEGDVEALQVNELLKVSYFEAAQCDKNLLKTMICIA